MRIEVARGVKRPSHAFAPLAAVVSLPCVWLTMSEAKDNTELEPRTATAPLDNLGKPLHNSFTKTV